MSQVPRLNDASLLNLCCVVLVLPRGTAVLPVSSLFSRTSSCPASPVWVCAADEFGQELSSPGGSDSKESAAMWRPKFDP